MDTPFEVKAEMVSGEACGAEGEACGTANGGGAEVTAGGDADDAAADGGGAEGTAGGDADDAALRAPQAAMPTMQQPTPA
eukprot:972554-Pleurochrysis_carterae.AAC.1